MKLCIGYQDDDKSPWMQYNDTDDYLVVLQRARHGTLGK